MIEGTAGIAAPVLAGFSLALVGVIAQDPTHFRWPGATLAVLMAPIFCLLYAVRVGTRVRGIASGDAEGLYAVRVGTRARPLSFGESTYEILSRRTFLMYGIGISSLWACIGMTAAPPDSGGREMAFRWVAFALAIAAGIVEAGWSILRLRARGQEETSVAIMDPPSPGER
jgi:hypothetical protein